MSWIGDFRLESTFDTKFTTVTTTGAPTVLAGSPVISAYVGNSVTQITAGITLTVDFDGVVGLNNIRVVATAANGYATASNYQLVITTGTVGGTSVVGYVVAEFSIEARSAVMPTVAARTLDVTATGAAGVDWANVESQGTTVGLTATTVATVTTTATATAVTTVNGLAANVITAAATAADFGTEIAGAVWNEDATGHQTTGTFGQAIGDPVADTNTIFKAVVTDAAGATVGVDVVAVKAETASIQTDTNDLQTQIGAAGAGLTAINLPDQTMNITGNVTGNLSGSVGSVTGAVGSVTGAVGSVAAGGIAAAAFAAGAIDAAAIATGAIDADALAADAATELRSLVTGTADAGGTSTTMVDAARSEADDVWNGSWLMFTSGAVANQTRLITNFDAATDTATFAPAATAAVGAGITYEILPAGAVDLQSWLGTVTALSAPSALISGRVDANTQAMAANVITSSILATDAIGAAQIAAGAIGASEAPNLDAAVSSRMATYVQPAGFLAATFPAGTVANTTNITAGTITTATNLTTNNDKTGYSVGVGGIAATAFAAGAIDATAIAANAIGASELAQDAAQEVADEVLNRDLVGGASGNTRNVRNALRALRNRSAISAGTLTVYAEDDIASAWTAAVTTAAGNPISEVDPV